MKNTVATIMKQKSVHDRIAMLTAYDYSTARLIDEAGVEMILVGDSLGMVMLGYEDTISVTMEDMIHHTAADSTALASLIIFLAASMFLPCTLKPPNIFTDWGVIPICATTGMDASVIALI